MPGVVMDNHKIGGERRASNIHDQMNGVLSGPGNTDQTANSVDLQNGSLHVNGVGKFSDSRQNNKPASMKMVPATSREPPQLLHITQGFFPFSKLVNRSVQQCWNDLSDLIAELAEIQVSSQDSGTPSLSANGKLPGNQSPENLRKKIRAMEFAQAKRAEFIKLLVLSQWSRQAADVSKLIDIQNYIRTQHQAYSSALQWMGDMKRDLVQAQVANPDLKTALEVLSKGEVVSMPDLGYKPPKSLTPKSTLKKLQKINRIISARLALHETIPIPFQTYRVHDGRVTFVVPDEFELDLSVGEESDTSQFFFVDIRFLFNPSSSIPKGRVFSELDLKVNEILRTGGLTGCFDWLHSLVLTNKINILTKQAGELAKGLWSNVLRIELLHRTLVLQYWASTKHGTKSWLEIGIQRGGQAKKPWDQPFPTLGLRWMRDGQEVDPADVEFDTENLSVESLLRSVIALHISHILSSAYMGISAKLLFSSGALSLRAHLTKTEPGDCQLDVQLTASRKLRVAIEPMSGAIILSATPSALDRTDMDRNVDRPTVDDIIARVSRLRCGAAIEEVESKVKMFGFEPVSPRKLRFDARRVFPTGVLRISFFWNHLWERNWMLAATSSMDGDSWWVVQTRPAESANSYPILDANLHPDQAFCSAQIICNTLFPLQETGYSSLADLGHCLSGVLVMHANARFLEDLQFLKFFPPLHKLKIDSTLQVPDIMIRYEASILPQALQIALPAGFKKKTLIKDTIRLAFGGIDRQKKVAIMVAYGNLCIPSRAFSALIPKEDRSLVFQKTGTGFALRLLAPVGYPVLIALLENLQRLECVLSICETLQRKKIEPLSLSLSHICFAYGPNKDLSARLDIGVSQPMSHMEMDPVKLASRVDRLLHLHLGIRFENCNPHRRIQETLASNLNRPSADVGLDNIAELLSFTLPLMRALDRRMANPSYNEGLKMQVIVRSAKSFHIHYPNDKLRFQLVASQHLSRSVWVLKDIGSTQNGTGEDEIRRQLQESLYKSRGEGWRGLGNGVVAEPEFVGHLLDELDKHLTSIGTSLPPNPLGIQVNSGLPETVTQLLVKGQGRPPDRADNNKGMQQQPGAAATQNADIITID
ncbi:hypothetical protein ARAM_001963 [Aspergillus rambellii]|uniref:Mediator of RNA polymerase II transcription subunit 14 n=1 Tax=Aspergillus rambellii TaxID=308745 RepID=A0A0F8UY34_9EURO|nr:hypothetical protein ARAM_001963 [Aspergillus rambellii]